MKASTMTVGVVGCGAISAKTHLPVLKAMDDVRIGWLTDAQPSQARRLGRSFGLPTIDLPADLAALPEADVVLLAIPYGVRAPYYDALAGRRTTAVYVEKPFARSRRELEALVARFDPWRIGGGFQRRALAPVWTLREIIENGLFGRLREVRFGFGKIGATSGGAHADIRVSGGGMLFESAIHGIDALLFITQATSARVIQSEMISDGGFDLHTTAQITLLRVGGESVLCSLKVTCLEMVPNGLEFLFDSASVTLNVFGEGQLSVHPYGRPAGYQLADPHRSHPVLPYETAYENWRVFLGGFREEKSNWTSASESLLTAEIIEALYAAQPAVAA